MLHLTTRRTGLYLEGAISDGSVFHLKSQWTLLWNLYSSKDWVTEFFTILPYLRITVSLEAGCWDCIIMAFPMDWVTEVFEIRYLDWIYLFISLKQTWIRFKLCRSPRHHAGGMWYVDVRRSSCPNGNWIWMRIWYLRFMACFKLHLLWSFPGMMMVMFYPRWFLNILFLFVTFSEDWKVVTEIEPEAVGPMRKINFGRWIAKVF